MGLAGPFTFMACFVYGKRCFMSKQKGLELYDKIDLHEHGCYIGRLIAKKENRYIGEV